MFPDFKVNNEPGIFNNWFKLTINRIIVREIQIKRKEPQQFEKCGYLSIKLGYLEF